MFLYIKTNILRGYGIFKNDFAHPREPATAAATSCPHFKWGNNRTQFSFRHDNDIFKLLQRFLNFTRATSIRHLTSQQ